EKLSAHLQQMLCLPDYGEVQIEVIVDRFGKLQGWELVSARSSVNRDYVKAHLPKLVFPRFQDSFDGEDEHRFLICLGNQF
ncbi:MAG: hypothetical protein KDK78_09380, partial [Chlamydiia bacterium]|nr:hypothetical protein [Chlamydiia bacterium]